MFKPKVIIIGAGLAGLTAAYELRKMGIVPTILEATDRIGGRVLTIRDEDTGAVSDLGGQFINAQHKDIIELSNELGVELIKQAIQPSFILEGRTRTLKEFLDDSPDLCLQLTRDHFRAKSDTEYANKLNSMSAEEYLQTVPGPDWVKLVLAHHTSSEAGRPVQEQSAYAFVCWHGHESIQDRCDIFSSGYGEFQVKNGCESLTQQLLGHNSDALETNFTVEALKATSHGFIVEGGKRAYTADAIVLAIPYFALRRILLIGINVDSDQADAIRSLRYAQVEKIVVQTDRNPFPPSINHLDSPDNSTSLWLNAHESTLRNSYSIYSMGARATQLTANPQLAIQEAEAAFSACSEGTVLTKRYKASNWKERLGEDGGGYSVATPGDCGLFFKAISKNLCNGGIALAGEDKSNFFGTMNTAVKTGKDAAHVVAKFLGHTKR